MAASCRGRKYIFDNYGVVPSLCINVMLGDASLAEGVASAMSAGTLTLLYPSLDTVLSFRGRILRQSAFPEIQFASVKKTPSERGDRPGASWGLEPFDKKELIGRCAMRLLSG
jgi:hypothetical protein